MLGIVRFAATDEPVDVIVGRGAWIAPVRQRRLRIEAGGYSLPVVERACERPAGSRPTRSAPVDD